MTHDQRPTTNNIHHISHHKEQNTKKIVRYWSILLDFFPLLPLNFPSKAMNQVVWTAGCFCEPRGCIVEEVPDQIKGWQRRLNGKWWGMGVPSSMRRRTWWYERRCARIRQSRWIRPRGWGRRMGLCINIIMIIIINNMSDVSCITSTSVFSLPVPPFHIQTLKIE